MEDQGRRLDGVSYCRGTLGCASVPKPRQAIGGTRSVASLPEAKSGNDSAWPSGGARFAAWRVDFALAAEGHRVVNPGAKPFWLDTVSL